MTAGAQMSDGKPRAFRYKDEVIIADKIIRYGVSGGQLTLHLVGDKLVGIGKDDAAAVMAALDDYFGVLVLKPAPPAQTTL